MIDPKDVVICTIHGGSGRYSGEYALRHPWPRLQMEQLRRHTPPGFRVYAYGNRTLPEHEAYLRQCPEVTYFSSEDIKHGWYPHVWPLRNWLGRQAVEKHRFVVHLDSDAFPVADDWLEHYCGMITDTCPVVAAQPLEINFRHSDRMFLIYSREGYHRHHFDFSPVGVEDPGGAISGCLEARGLQWYPLNRSNAVNYHRSLAGIYDGRIYHQGAGSRLPKWMDSGGRFRRDGFFKIREVLVQELLMETVFFRTESLLRQLKGEEPPMDMDREILRAARGRFPLFALRQRLRMRRGKGHSELGYV